MTAYEFTKFNVTFPYRQKALQCNMDRVYQLININNPGRDFTKDPEYKDAHNIFIDLTMSCDRGEAMNWMMEWVVDAVAYGFQTGNTDWQHKFLAARDILNSL